MKHFTKLPQILTLICLFLCSACFGQGIMGVYPLTTVGSTATTATAWAPVNNTPSIIRPASNYDAVLARRKRLDKTPNYKSFTPVKKNLSAEAMTANAGYESHPDFGVLYAGAPCNDCYELLSERTENTKTFVREGIHEGGKEKMTQTSTQPMHYRDANGNWLTIKTQLQPDAAEKGIYTISTDITPVMINTREGNSFSSLGIKGERIEFNRNLELIYVQPNGKEVSLGLADYTHHTAGDEGVYVQNAWPGIDIEMSMMRGAIKTNFHVNHALPDYANGKILIRDHLLLDRGLNLNTGGRTEVSGELIINDDSGNPKYGIGEANVYEQGNHQNTIEQLKYEIGENSVLDIALPGSYLNKPELSYPIIIDPLVTLATSTTVNGSTYMAALTATSGCAYLNAAMTPANCTVTDIQFAFEYTTVAPNVAEYAGSFFYKGTCRSPGTLAAGYVWTCGPPAGAAATVCDATGGATYSIWGTPGASTSGLGPCMPAPSCVSIPLNITMYFYQSWATTATGCVTTWAYGSLPLVLTVIGHTVELTAAGVTGTPATICAGQSATLSATGTYGVPPYTYSWTPGPVLGSPATVTPGSTTTYNLTVTDACGITTTGSTTITVNPTTPITGTLSMCIGNTTTLADATAGGTWSSSTPAVATIGAGSGVAMGVGSGTSTITYTTPGGCQAFAVVTVTPLPVAITGTPFMCQGSTTTLNDVTTGGAWSSSNTAVATVTAGGGVVTGVSGGTATITYGTPGCVATITVTVNPTPDISGTASTNPTTCNGTDGTITLSGLTAGDTYTVHYTAPSGPVTATIVANGTGNVVITGLGGGTYSAITVTNSFGCVSNSVGPVVLVASGNPPAPVLTNSSPVCDGGTVSFTATDAATGVTYNWSGPGGFTSALQNPVINPATLSANGTYTATVTLLGCTSAPATTVVTVNPVPVIAIINSSNPSTCLGSDGSITLSVTGLAGGVTYGVIYTDNGTALGYSFTSTATGNLVIPGLSAGTYDGINVTSPAGCTSNNAGPVILSDPGAPPIPTISANIPLCVGQTLILQGNDLTAGGTYSWTFADGTTSSLQNPTIPITTVADIGNYTLSYNIANCISSATVSIPLYPPIILTNMTPNTAINYGSSIQLNVEGALYYWWRPDDGSLNNTNINNPIATPKDSTVYTVVATSQWGCTDSAHVTITVNNVSPVIIPSAFTPNGDGLNDIFRVGNLKYQKLVEFSVYNRWGQLVYHNTWDPKEGWDGTFNGAQQDMGVYNYIIILADPNGNNVVYKGDVTLIR